MIYNGETYEPVRVMLPSGDQFVILVPANEASRAHSEGVIRFAYSRNQVLDEPA